MELWFHHSDTVGYPLSSIEMKRRRFSCGSVGCFGGWTEVLCDLNGSPSRAKDYLRLTAKETDLLFYDFPETPVRSWKKWMLERLDGVIKAKKITRVV